MKSILVPYDFSEVAKNALHFAHSLAAKVEDSDVVLFYVIEHPTDTSFNTMGIVDYDPTENVYIAKMVESIQERMDNIINDETYSDITLRYKIVIGNPFIEITSEIVEEEVDLVVMGTEGSEGLDELFVGSNAEKVVRHAKCPVITLKEEVNVDFVEDIVFASDFEMLDENFVPKLIQLQDVLGAQLRLVRINTPNNFISDRAAVDMMEEFAGKFELDTFTIDLYSDLTEEDGILNFAEDEEAGIIALGTHGRKGISHILSGSIAEDIVNHSKLPVWTLNLDG